MGILLIYEFMCDECGYTKRSGPGYTIQEDYRYQLPRPALPDGWFSFMAKIFCHQHDVTWKVSDRDSRG